MTDVPLPPPTPPARPKPGLQFDWAESTQRGRPAASCAVCSRPVENSYYLAGATTWCVSCREAYQQALTAQAANGSFLKALVFGIAAAMAGMLLYHYFVKWAGFQFLWFYALLLGGAVGIAVKSGSGGRGGKLFQGLAMVLTYVGIAGTFVPLLAEKLPVRERVVPIRGAESKDPPAPAVTEHEETKSDGTAVTMVMIVLIALAMPFLGGLKTLFILLLIGIGLFEAWKINRRPGVQFQGPYPIGPASEGVPR